MKQRMLKLVRFVSFTTQLHLHLIYNTTKSDNVYKRHAAFGKRYEHAHDVYCRHEETQTQKSLSTSLHICLYANTYYRA